MSEKVKINSEDKKLLSIEGLRGILAIIVVINHFILLFCPIVFSGSFDLNDFVNNATSFKMLLANSPLNVFMNGHFAVCVFFGISGYVLTLNYKNTNNTKVLQKSIVKRYFRLAIPVLATCLLIYILFLLHSFVKANYPTGDSSLDFGQSLFKNNLSFFEMVKMALFDVPVSGNNQYLPVLWTIQIEFLGALILFSFLLFTHNLESKWIYGLIIIGVCAIILKYYAPILFIGSLTCIYEEKLKKTFKNNFIKLLLLFGFLYFAGIPNISKEANAHTIYSFTNHIKFNVYPYFHNLATACLLMLIVSSNKLEKILSFKYLAQLGKLSFSVYLLHLPILYCLGTYLMRANNGKINMFVLFLICFSVVIAVSIVFYKFIDKTAISSSNKLAKRFLDIEV